MWPALPQQPCAAGHLGKDGAAAAQGCRTDSSPTQRCSAQPPLMLSPTRMSPVTSERAQGKTHPGRSTSLEDGLWPWCASLAIGAGAPLVSSGPRDTHTARSLRSPQLPPEAGPRPSGDGLEEFVRQHWKLPFSHEKRKKNQIRQDPSHSGCLRDTCQAHTYEVPGKGHQQLSAPQSPLQATGLHFSFPSARPIHLLTESRSSASLQTGGPTHRPATNGQNPTETGQKNPRGMWDGAPSTSPQPALHTDKRREGSRGTAGQAGV